MGRKGADRVPACAAVELAAGWAGGPPGRSAASLGPTSRHASSPAAALRYVTEAIAALGKAAERAPKVLGPDHLITAQIFDELGAAYMDIHRYREAEANYRKGVQMLERKLGGDNVRLAVCLNSLALACSHIK